MYLILSIAHYFLYQWSTIFVLLKSQNSRLMKQARENNQLMALIFDQYRKKYNGTFQNFVGGLGSYIYNFDSYYFRIDGAVSHIKETLMMLLLFPARKLTMFFLQ